MRMKHTRNTTFCILLICMTLTSCGDFLEEVSQDEFEPKTASSFH